jgi:NADH-quinone oxidoreductase subunit A
MLAGMDHLFPGAALNDLWPLALYSVLVAVIVGAMIGISYLLGERHRERATGEPYESGIVSTGSARLLLSVQFYVVAMIFVIFDLEAIFFFAWAVALRDLGWGGYIGILVFTLLLVTGLLYEWRQGALDWSAWRDRPERPGAVRPGAVSPGKAPRSTPPQERRP